MKKLEDYAREKESERLAFQSAGAVGDPRVVPRAVCALLNASGGEVVVGLRETGGSFRPDPVPDVERARVIVRDRIASSIEPLPPAELDVQVVPGAAGSGLRVTVPLGQASLHALRERHGSWSFVRRVGERTVPLPWSEALEQLSSGARRRTKRADAAANIAAEMRAWRESCAGAVPLLEQIGGLYLVARVFPQGHAPPDGWDRELEAWYRDPTLLGIARHGAHFLYEQSTPRRRRGRPRTRSSGAWESGYKIAEYTDDAALHFATERNSLLDSTQDDADRPIVHPRKLVELPASFTRVFAGMWERSANKHAEAWLSLELTRTEGLVLPYPAHSFGHVLGHGSERSFEETRVGPFRARTTLEELAARPDSIAYRLLRPVYQSFGRDDDEVPYYDQDRARFIFD